MMKLHNNGTATLICSICDRRLELRPGMEDGVGWWLLDDGEYRDRVGKPRGLELFNESDIIGHLHACPAEACVRLLRAHEAALRAAWEARSAAVRGPHDLYQAAAEAATTAYILKEKLAQAMREAVFLAAKAHPPPELRRYECVECGAPAVPGSAGCELHPTEAT